MHTEGVVSFEIHREWVNTSSNPKTQTSKKVKSAGKKETDSVGSVHFRGQPSPTQHLQRLPVASVTALWGRRTSRFSGRNGVVSYSVSFLSFFHAFYHFRSLVIIFYVRTTHFECGVFRPLQPEQRLGTCTVLLFF